MSEKNQPTLLPDNRLNAIRMVLSVNGYLLPGDAHALLAEVDRLRRRLETVEHNANQYRKERDRLLNQEWSDAIPPGGYVCATCGEPVESEPCSEHAPDVLTEEAAQNAKIAEAARAWKRAKIATKTAYELSCYAIAGDPVVRNYYQESSKESHACSELLKVIGDVNA